MFFFRLQQNLTNVTNVTRGFRGKSLGHGLTFCYGGTQSGNWFRIGEARQHAAWELVSLGTKKGDLSASLFGLSG